MNESRSNDEHEKFQYNIPRLIPIRQLIFNNPHIRYVHDNYQSDPERWREWLKIFSFDDDFLYLQDRFGSFIRFLHVIEFFKLQLLNHIGNVGGVLVFYFHMDRIVCMPIYRQMQMGVQIDVSLLEAENCFI